MSHAFSSEFRSRTSCKNDRRKRERKRQIESEQPHGEQCMQQCSGYYPSPSLSLSQTSVVVRVGSRSRRKEHGKSHLSGEERRERGERVSEAAAEGNVADGGRIHLSSLLAAVAVERKRNPRRVAPSLGRCRSSVGPFAALRQETNLHATSNDEMSRKGLSR